jgi:hypothetical protein
MPTLDKGRAISLLFRGYSARETAKKLKKTSNVSVSNLLRKFISEAEEAGDILVAAAKYGLEEQVKTLIDLGKVVEETKVDPSMAGLGLRIVKSAKDLEVDPEGIPELIEVVVKETTSQHLSPEIFVKTAKGLHGFTVDGIRDYQKLLRSVEENNAEYKRLDHLVDEYGEKAEKAKNDMDEAVKNGETTLEELSQFTALRSRLSSHGLDLRDVEKVETCLLNIVSQDFDSKAVVAVYSKNSDLSKKVSELDRRSNLLFKMNHESEGHLKEINKTLESKKELVGRVREAEDLGLKPVQLGVLVDCARRSGASHGLGIYESVDRLAGDIVENWEQMLGFEDEKVKRSVELDQVNEKIRLAEEKERITVEKVRADELALKGLGELRKFVSLSEIIEFKKVIVDSGLDVPTFRVEAEKQGGATVVFNSVKQKRDAELARLESRVITLNAQVVQLEKKKAELEAGIYILNSEALDAVRKTSEDIRQVAESLRLDFEDPETGYNARIRSLGEDAVKETAAGLKAKREAIRQSLETVNTFVRRSLSDIESLKKGTWDTAKVLGFNLYLTRVANIVNDEPVGKIEALTTMMATVDAFNGYLKRNEIDCPSVSKFSGELRNAFLGGL